MNIDISLDGWISADGWNSRVLFYWFFACGGEGWIFICVYERILLYFII